MTLTTRLGTSPTADGVKSPCVVSSNVNITLSGEQTIDGKAVVAGDRVLVRSQTDASENGVYDAAVSAWSRSPDWNADDDISAAILVMDSHNETIYSTSFTGTFTLGTTDVTFNAVPLATIVTPGGLQSGSNLYAAGAGTVDVITATFTPAITTYVNGMEVRVRASGANTSTTPTINLDSVGAKTIVKNGNQALLVGDIPRANYEMTLRYNSSSDKFELLNPALENQVVQIVNTLATAKTIAGTTSRDIHVRGRTATGDGYQGQFFWDASDLSTEVAADTTNALYIPPNSDATGASGAWVRNSKDGPWSVLWFGANGDQPDDGSGTVDSQPAFQAAHDLLTALVSSSHASSLRTSYQKRIIIPANPSPDGYYYLGSRVASNSDGSTSNVCPIWEGETIGGLHVGLVKIAKAGDDFAFLNFEGDWAFKDFIIQGQGPDDPSTNTGTTENYPGILSFRSIAIDNVMVERCGGPDYASKMNTEFAVSHVASTGRTPALIDAHGTHLAGADACFGIGVLADTGLGGDGNVNTSRITNVFGNSIFGDVVFVSSVTSSDANACDISVKDTRNILGSVITINAGWKNRGLIQEAIYGEACAKFTNKRAAGPGQTRGNKIEVIYAGDAISRGAYFDNIDGSTDDWDRFLENRFLVQERDAITGAPDTIMDGPSVGYLKRNSAEFPVTGDNIAYTGRLEIGPSCGAHESFYKTTFLIAASPVTLDVITDIISSYYAVVAAELHKVQYELVVKLNNGDRSYDGWAQYLLDFRGGTLYSVELHNVVGAGSRTVALSGTTLTLSSTANTTVECMIRRKGSYPT